MKRYQVTKIVYADNIEQIVTMERGGEITYIELKDDIRNQEDIGFIKTNGEGQGKRLVSKVR